MSEEIRKLQLLWECRYPLIYIQTLEETQALDLLQKFCASVNTPLFCWSTADGLHRDLRGKSEYNTSSLDAALRHIDQSLQNGLFVLLDPHSHLDDPVTQRLLREVAQENYRYNRVIVLIGPAIELPPEISVLAAEYVLPTIAAHEIRLLLNEEATLWRNESGNAPQAQQNALDLMVRYLTGTSREFAQRIIRHAIRDDGKITRDDLKVILEQKRIALGDSLIDFCFSEQNVSDIGGLPNLKSWVALRQKPFLQPDPESGIDIPKGLLLLGVQGCGKSLAAKAVAGSWGVPLLRLDFGSLYNKFFGESERNLRKALHAAEAMAPCVLWVDEIEKGLASDSGGGADGGVSRRILGTLLTWLSERQSQVFLIATANDVTSLPPELMRKGRFDELFFVDLPAAAFRGDIFKLHLARRKQDLSLFDLNELATLSAGFSGAEIEACIRQSLLEAYAQERKATQSDLATALRQTKPLSVLRAEEIDSLRHWASERTIFA